MRKICQLAFDDEDGIAVARVHSGELSKAEVMRSNEDVELPPDFSLKIGSGAAPDYLSTELQLPILSERLVSALEPYSNGLQFVEVNVVGPPSTPLYFLMNCKNQIDCLDHEQSEFTYFKSGHLMTIKKWRFDYSLLPGDVFIFSIPQNLGVFFTEEAAFSLKGKGLSGIVFINR